MYYEEKLENGHWYWRSTPNGEWFKFSYVALEQKCLELQAKLDQLGKTGEQK